MCRETAAAEMPSRSASSPPWAHGNAAVRDTKCDGNSVYIYFEAKRSTGQIYSTKHRENGDGCGKTRSWSGLTYDAGFYIGAVQVVTCVDDLGSDTCYKSGFKDNPLT